MRTVRAASVGCLAEESAPTGLATGEDDAQAASAGSSVAAVPRRIIEEDKLDRREQPIP